MTNTNEILSNVAWLVDALDDDGLHEVRDLPFLEMAKVVRIAGASARGSSAAS